MTNKTTQSESEAITKISTVLELGYSPNIRLADLTEAAGHIKDLPTGTAQQARLTSAMIESFDRLVLKTFTDSGLVEAFGLITSLPPDTPGLTRYQDGYEFRTNNVSVSWRNQPDSSLAIVNVRSGPNGNDVILNYTTETRSFFGKTHLCSLRLDEPSCNQLFTFASQIKATQHKNREIISHARGLVAAAHQKYTGCS